VVPAKERFPRTGRQWGKPNFAAQPNTVFSANSDEDYLLSALNA
jgi:hypothetical protein